MYEQYQGLTNAEVYQIAFHKLLMLPDPLRPGKFLGNSQREQFLPVLERALARLKALSVPRILDVGAGSGEIVEIALSRLHHAVISIEEPNPLLLQEYRREV